MKRIVLFAIIACFAAVSAFAQTYTVSSVTGRVQRDSGGRMVNVAVGDVLTEDTVVRTAIGASLVLTAGNSTFTIPAGRNGRISVLLAADAPAGGAVAHAETGAITRTTGQIQTASARGAIVAIPGATEEDEDSEDENIE